MALSQSSTRRLNNGVEIPLLGLGVYLAESGGETKRAVLEAFKAGYRHVDTARAYENEADVGEAVRDSGLRREELFVTTKLWNSDHGHAEAKRALEKSLKRMKLEYVDLFLIHWPVQGKRDDSWRALVELQKEGKARAIGVSNYLPRHLEELARASDVVPQVNQIELHPFLTQRETVEYCAARDIAIEAYSPLVKARRMKHPELGEIARQVGRSPAQVLLRWGLQHGYIVLPKSVTPERIRENAALYDFALDEAQMKRLDGLNEDLFTGWDSRTVP